MQFSPNPAVETETSDFVEFLLHACRIMIESGCSSNRVEHLNAMLGASWGFEVETMALPTGVWIAVRRGDERVVDLTRVQKWTVDLDRLARLNDLIESIHARNVSFKDAKAMIREVGASPPPYSSWLSLVAGGGSSAVLVYSYQGTPLEVLLAIPGGICVQVLQKYAFVSGERRYLADFMSAVFVAVYACMCQTFFPSIDLPRLIVGGIIALIPGLVLVNAVHEIAQKNLVSGAAKLLEGLVITASLGCGVLFVLGVLSLF